MRSPTICPVSWPLPAISSASPGSRPAIAVRIASARSPMSFAALAALRIADADQAGVLAARIVVGNDDAVGIVGGNRAHQRTLAGIAVAAGAEHHDKPALRVRPQCLQRLRQRVGLVGVIDKDRRAVVFADPFQPALGAFETFECGKHRLRRAAGTDCEAGRDQRILDLEFTDQRQPHRRSLRPRCSSASFCEKPSISAASRRMPSPAPSPRVPTVTIRRPRACAASITACEPS